MAETTETAEKLHLAGLDELHRHANWFLGLTLLYLGEFSSARVSLEQVVNSYDPKQHGFLAYIISQDAGVSCLSWLGWTLWFLGYPDQAQKRCKDAIVLAKKMNHPFTLAFAHGIGFFLNSSIHEFKAAKEHTEVFNEIGKREGFGLFLAMDPFVRGKFIELHGTVDETEQGTG